MGGGQDGREGRTYSSLRVRKPSNFLTLGGDVGEVCDSGCAQDKGNQRTVGV